MFGLGKCVSINTVGIIDTLSKFLPENELLYWIILKRILNINSVLSIARL